MRRKTRMLRAILRQLPKLRAGILEISEKICHLLGLSAFV